MDYLNTASIVIRDDDAWSRRVRFIILLQKPGVSIVYADMKFCHGCTLGYATLLAKRQSYRGWMQNCLGYS